MKNELIVDNTPKSPISEMFRTLRTNIQFMDTNNSDKVILVTSTLAGEGKSWISANLAITFAQTGKRVLLIDGDMRKGRQYSIFEVSPRPGLSNYLSGIDINNNKTVNEDMLDYIQKTKIDNLYVMTSGNVPPNPSELLNSTKMLQMLSKAKELFDIIIIDSTPSQFVADALILAKIVDSTIIVTSCKETRREELRKIITSIKNIGGKISGVVLNKVPLSGSKYEKKYYYYASTRVKKDEKNNVKPKIANDLKNLRLDKYNNTLDGSMRKTNEMIKEINDYLGKEKTE